MIASVFSWMILLVTCIPCGSEPGDTAGTNLSREYVEISTIAQLREAFRMSHQKVRLKPGVYTVNDLHQDGQSVFFIDGSHNHFLLEGATIRINTELFQVMLGKTHRNNLYCVYGDHNVVEGAKFEEFGDGYPVNNLNTLLLDGDGNTFRDCEFHVRGSRPYGYGSLFGIGGSAGFPGGLHKHSAISVLGDSNRITGCRIFMHSFGHAIHIHGARETRVEGTYIEGRLRSTDDMLAETSGLARDNGFQILHRYYKGEDIPPGSMVALSEDGVRAYSDGRRQSDPDAPLRKTGMVTVINCKVVRMRKGFPLSRASGAHIEHCEVREIGHEIAGSGAQVLVGKGFYPPSNTRIIHCRGDAPYAPLLYMDKNIRNVEATFELLESEVSSLEDAPVMIINGEGHKIRVKTDQSVSLPDEKVIAISNQGHVNGWWRNDQFAKAIRLVNETPVRVVLGERSEGCEVRSAAVVQDEGKNNTVTGR